MATLDDISFVQIGLNTAAVSRADFGTALIAGPLMSFTERVRSYSTYEAATADNLPPEILAAVRDGFSQTPHPRFIKVGRRAVATANIVINAVNNTEYTITVTGTSPEVYNFTSDASATAAEIATGLALAITNDTNETLTATVVGNELRLAWISQSNLQAVKLGSNLTWGAIATVDTVAVDMAAIKQSDNGWYVLLSSDRTKQVQLDFAAWTETQDKLFGIASSEADIRAQGVTTDVISTLRNTQYFRTFAGYSATADTQYADSAWANDVLVLEPGKVTWNGRRLAGITPDNLTPTERITVLAKGGNTFEFMSGQNIALTSPGKTAAGEWIDVIRGRDWLKNLIQTNMAQLIINRDIIPYTDAGIQLCATVLRKSLQQAVNTGVIAPDEIDPETGKTVPGFVIFAPASQSIDPLVKASRVLTLTFQARLAGAIHVVNITGSLGYELN